MIQVILHTVSDRQIQEPVSEAAIKEVLATPNNFLWLDLADPKEEEIALLGREFGFHELALEDVRRAGQRPKLDQYDSYYFLVLYTAKYEDEDLRLTELMLFVGDNYIVTAHSGDVPELEETKERWHHDRGQLRHGPSRLLYSLADTIGDSYFPLIDRISDELDDLETAIFDKPDQRLLQRLFAWRKDLLALRRIIAPERDVLNLLLRNDLQVLDERAEPYFQDVYDHLLRQLESIDLYRDLLAAALDAYLSVVSNDLNSVMRRLTALTVIVMVPTLIAGIYGMNFHFMPELTLPWGYFGALGLMAMVAAVLAFAFWRYRWL